MQPPADHETRAPAARSAGTSTDAGTERRAAEPVYAIRARGLSKTYAGPHRTTQAVRGLDLDVLRGETYAFLGPNGAGKSTTIALLCALTRPTAGRATVAGADIRARPEQVRQRVGMLFQHSALDADLTAEQNLYIHARLYGLDRRRARLRVTETLEAVQLADRHRAPVRILSGGMRRRLELARGLLHAPEVLFLDEPTAGLDPHARAQVWEHLRTLRDRHGTTLFVTTHYLEEAENCDRIGIIDQGRLVARGTPAALKAEIGDDRVTLRTGDDTAALHVMSRAAPSGRVVTLDDEGVSLRVPDGSSWIPRLCSALVSGNITVHAASATPPTLNDVFFHHTGRSIDVPRPHAMPTRLVAGKPAAAEEKELS